MCSHPNWILGGNEWRPSVPLANYTTTLVAESRNSHRFGGQVNGRSFAQDPIGPTSTLLPPCKECWRDVFSLSSEAMYGPLAALNRTKIYLRWGGLKFEFVCIGPAPGPLNDPVYCFQSRCCDAFFRSCRAQTSGSTPFKCWSIPSNVFLTKVRTSSRVSSPSPQPEKCNNS